MNVFHLILSFSVCYEQAEHNNSFDEVKALFVVVKSFRNGGAMYLQKC
jgi:hypothetical protein